jgi:metal-responsive CopG/Arc/MetJ family transcriptional regulator
MKIKVSISMEESTLKKVKESLKVNLFRSKSHFIEVATEKYLKEVNHE